MKILFVHPPLYTFYNFHNTHQYPVYMYNLATKYKMAGNEVRVVDMHPELAFNPKVSSLENGDMYYDGHLLISDTKIIQECGNFDAERLAKPIIRSGLPKSILQEALASSSFDKIIICDLGSKADITSSSLYYSHLGIEEVINIIKETGYTGEISVSGKYSKIFKDTNGLDKFYDDDCELLDTDLSLIPYKPRRIGVTTSLGCHNNCFFCFVRGLEGDKIVYKDPSRVADFIDYIVSRGHKNLRIMDSDILSSWDTHMLDVFNRIIVKKYNLSVTSYGGFEPSSVTDEVMEKSLAIGFTKIVLPLDNGDESTLSFWGGGSKSVDAWKKAVAIAKKYYQGSSIYINTMIGYPGQTRENITEAISMCLDLGVNPILLPFTPLDGTGYEDNSISPEKKHPLLFPYAWDKLTMFDIEHLLEKYNTWYKKSTVRIADGPKVYMETGESIPTNGVNTG
jgi:hypothetical protein